MHEIVVLIKLKSILILLNCFLLSCFSLERPEVRAYTRVMRKIYILFRILGYVFGLVGIGLFFFGQQPDVLNPQLKRWGVILVLSGFVSFIIAYFLLAILQIQRRKY